jgi:hypothetical protein
MAKPKKKHHPIKIFIIIAAEISSVVKMRQKLTIRDK